MMMMMMNCFCGIVNRRKVEPYFQPGPLSEILTIANLWHAAIRIWTSAEPGFRLWWMKLCNSHNHYTTTLTFSYLWTFTLVSIKKIVSSTFFRYLTWKLNTKEFSFIFLFLLAWSWSIPYLTILALSLHSRNFRIHRWLCF